MIEKSKSNRADGLGHWPRGKRRSDIDARTRRRALASIRRAHVRDGHSLRSIARTIGVSDRTLRRWLAGEDHPSPARAADVISAHLPALDARSRR
jgi:transposase-like protein